MHQDRLLARYARNDLARNAGVNAALLVVLILSAFLMATGAMVTERLAGSVNQLFAQAKPPHFLQMHTGEYDEGALERFAADHPEIDAWLIEEMLGYDGASVSFERAETGETGDMSASRIDNLFVTQNEEFDFLVDDRGGVPEPRPGEAHVPVRYQQDFGLQVGDALRVETDEGPHEFRIEGFVKDSQNASSLSPATRVLVADEDFARLTTAGGAAPEIVAEYRLADPGAANAFETAYESAAELPKNGQTVTYQMVQIAHVLSDGLLAVALIFVSLGLIVIALLNLRFVITGSVEDQVREIGTLKAIGIPDRAISRLFLAKYTVLALAACVIGGALAPVATSLLTQSLQANYAAAPIGPAAFLVPLAALAVVFVIVVAICATVLRRVRRIDVVTALVHGSTLDERQTARRAKRRARAARRATLASSSGRGVGRRLALLDLRAEARQWALIPVVFFLTSVIVTLPMNLLSTFENPAFASYMGAPDRDVMVTVQFQEGVDAVRRDVADALRSDERITDLQATATVPFRTENGILRVQVGDHSASALRLADGGMPKAGEIALSALNADKHQLGVGDETTIRNAGEETTVRVSGVYQDITSGGLTAKMPGVAAAGADAYAFAANAAPGEDPEAVADEYAERFPTAVVLPTDEYSDQVLSGMTTAFRSAVWLSLALGIGVTVLITSVFLTLRLARDRSTMGILSAIGFSERELVRQVHLKAMLTAGAGTLVGIVFAATAGEAMFSALLVALNLGFTDVSFLPDPLLVYGLFPALLLGACALGVFLTTAGIRRADKSTWLRGR